MALYRIREDWREIHAIGFTWDNMGEVTEFLNRHAPSAGTWTADDRDIVGGAVMWTTRGEYDTKTGRNFGGTIIVSPGQYVVCRNGEISVQEEDFISDRYYEV